MHSKIILTRRSLVTGSASLMGLVVSGCSTTARKSQPVQLAKIDPAFISMYAAKPEEKFPLPAVDLKKIPPQFFRRSVTYPTSERVGTVIVDSQNFYLYLVQENNRAIRYGVGLGRAGFAWSGRATIAWKRPWPTWTPPAEMILRQPELEIWSAKNGGMPPGPNNPLGARALYIFQNNVDTLYRLHGTTEDWSIGKAVSSGCVRLLNHDIIDLHARVPKGSPILVI